MNKAVSRQRLQWQVLWQWQWQWQSPVLVHLYAWLRAAL